ncbi:MAG: exo-beta-N-acetylmuramidase NamZ family protein [Limisphaerales bacterium]
MKTIRFFSFLFAALLAGCQTAPNKHCCKNCAAANHRAPVKPGIEVLFEKYPDLVRGKRVGLITNPAGVDSHLDSDVEVFRAHGVKLVALYGPEHGVRGNSQAGQTVPFYFDKDYQLPVFSLYGQTEKPPADMLTNIDEYMRSYDTQRTGKAPEAGALGGIDVMVYDLQDAGTRVYTFIATMAYAMQACANAGIPIIVLDRPNPIGGVTMEGPILQYPKYSSFIGLYPIPLRHGMTMGELAKLFNGKFFPAYGHKKANLTVVPMENWHRDEWFDQTGLPWVLPSPNLPTLDSATVYPGQVMLEGTDLSEGRGTTRPFEIFGAPWIDGFVLAKKLNELHLPGVKFREEWFTPTFSKFKGELCGGCQIHITDRNKYQSIATTLAELQTVKQLYGDKLEFHASYFDKVLGTSSVREALERGEPFQKIIAGFQPGLNDFAKLRAPFLLYH